MVNKKAKIVYVGLSGGVDSSVSAALLQKQGFDVRGVFIKVWSFDWTQDKQFTHCTAKEDRLDAMRVCAKLQIPFYTLDLEKKYKKEVVDYMITEYKNGRTPNPDVMCNKYVKFGLPDQGGFFDWAMKNGGDYVATGHYAQIDFDKKNNKYKLLAGKDKNKDQSYFLWTLTQEQLAKTLFPVGSIEKPEVRKLANKFGLETATKKDSQGLCFIGKVDIAEFLKNYITVKEGNVLNLAGQVVGVHAGAELYTIGQRHGFTLNNNSTNNKRSFIISKDINNNTIIISDESVQSIRKKNINKIINLCNVNWISSPSQEKAKKYQARIRYRGNLEDCSITKLITDSCELTFKESQNAPALGQSVVIYDDDICLGGGVIARID